MNKHVVHLLKSAYKSVFEGDFTLYWQILFLPYYTVFMAMAIPNTKIATFNETSASFRPHLRFQWQANGQQE